MTAAGTMRERVERWRLATTQRDDGGYDAAWVLQATYWASVEPVAVDAAAAAGRVSEADQYAITVRAASGREFAIADRIVWQGVRMAVASVPAVTPGPARGEFMSITATTDATDSR